MSVSRYPWPLLRHDKTKATGECVDNRCNDKTGIKQHSLKVSNKKPEEPFELLPEDI